ncbi:MAG TPA: SDR family NAD(P)-dependent oxidoreductase [Microbacterium sp.]|uniref:SDR family NAD(P)-dependent oxidoreductase n=1 Tax=Microbacterium sp. TaxID=51671 RepID=UPI002B489B66|nr:SDR family NAD(P)-dependent oxidoreductase [Microbacterium sp.]HKT58168.1 SDR family NAD(P)-dependent oxidoreductase [Microbacterium sp.]
MDQFESKVAVVTGAASGIGLGLVERFVQAGMSVMLSDVDEAGLDREVGRLRQEGADVSGFVADVSDHSQVEALGESVLRRWGALHLACNNAGVDAGAPFTDIPLSVWDWVMGVNFYGVLHGCQVFLPLIRESGGGHIVNTASLAALSGNTPTGSPYVTSKFAVLGLSENLAHELLQAEENVGLSVLCPAFVRTRMPESERNRPPGVADTSADPVRRAVVAHNARSAEAGLSVAEVAETTLDAIREGRFFVLPHRDEAIAATEARLRWMRDSVEPSVRPGRPTIPKAPVTTQKAAR